MIPVKDFMSLDPFRLFPNRMERLLEESLPREESAQSLDTTMRHLRNRQRTGDEVRIASGQEGRRRS